MDVTKTTTLSFNISGNVNNSDQPRTSQGSSGLIKNMYYATPFSSPGIIDGKLVNSSDETYSDGLKLPLQEVQVWDIMEMDSARPVTIR